MRLRSEKAMAAVTETAGTKPPETPVTADGADNQHAVDESRDEGTQQNLGDAVAHEIAQDAGAILLGGDGEGDGGQGEGNGGRGDHGSGDGGQERSSALRAAGICPGDGGVNAGIESAVEPQQQDCGSYGEQQHQRRQEPEAGPQVVHPKIQSRPHRTPPEEWMQVGRPETN